jgi:hypothetical protein
VPFVFASFFLFLSFQVLIKNFGPQLFFFSFCFCFSFDFLCDGDGWNPAHGNGFQLEPKHQTQSDIEKRRSEEEYEWG